MNYQLWFCSSDFGRREGQEAGKRNKSRTLRLKRLRKQEVEVEKAVSTAEVTTVSAITTTVDELTLAHLITVMSDSDEILRLHTQTVSSHGPLFRCDPIWGCYRLVSRAKVIENQEDEVFPADEQPLPAAALPTTQSPDYVPESDPEADPEKDDDENPKEDPDDEADDEVDIEADDDEEEEHPAPADSAVVALPAADQAPSAEETEPFETDESAATPPPHPAYRVTARISIPALVPTPVWSDAEIPSPPLPPIPSPSLPVSPPLPVSSPVPVLSPSPPASPIRLLGYRAAMIRLRAEAASTSHSLPLPPPIILSHTKPAAPSSGTPPLHLLSTNRREDRPEVTLPPRKRLGIALGPAYEVRERSSAAAARPVGALRADYGFVATMDREIRRDPERDVGYGISDSWDEIVETL
ncbi:hypothetical protein Tco_1226004 [Tanacetum coccineum]